MLRKSYNYLENPRKINNNPQEVLEKGSKWPQTHPKSKPRYICEDVPSEGLLGEPKCGRFVVLFVRSILENSFQEGNEKLAKK